ncbi:MAG: NAD(P)-binding domain-containing protein [Woeseiaceae bacterium]|nr:NAD(P)-binding domain-containing protein [Woeseiaceae bacterium]
MKAFVTCVLLLIASGSVAFADTIAVIGTGQVGSALGPEFAAQGHDIVYGSRNPDSQKVKDLVAKTPGNASATLPQDAIREADIVVLAVPGMMVEDIVRGLGDLSGKIVIDPTNPLTGDWSKEIRIGVSTSNGRIIQDAAPDAFVVKAFSTLNWRQMVEPGGDISIPLVGDSDEAKAKVAEIVSGMDLQPIDLGDIDNARWVEGMTILLLNNRIAGRPPFEYHLRVVNE